MVAQHPIKWLHNGVSIFFLSTTCTLKDKLSAPLTKHVNRFHDTEPSFIYIRPKENSFYKQAKSTFQSIPGLYNQISVTYKAKNFIQLSLLYCSTFNDKIQSSSSMKIFSSTQLDSLRHLYRKKYSIINTLCLSTSSPMNSVRESPVRVDQLNKPVQVEPPLSTRECCSNNKKALLVVNSKNTSLKILNHLDQNNSYKWLFNDQVLAKATEWRRDVVTRGHPSWRAPDIS